MEEKKKKVVKKEVKKEKEVKTTPKKVVKKTTIKPKEKKVVKNGVEERALKDEVTFGMKTREFISSYRFLYTAFGVLLVLVILLAVMVFVKGNEAKENQSNIVFSIMEENTRNYLNLDLQSLVGKEYTLKVTNYRNNKVNKNSSHYSITITNDTDVEIEILKNNEGNNLMTNQKESVIEGENFGTSEKEEVVYYFRVKNSDKIKEGDSIRIEVES